MPGFQFTHDMHAFEGVDLIVDYRISGTYQDLENFTFDCVEVLGRGINLSRDGWRSISRLHPLHRAVDRYLDTQDAADQAIREIRKDMESEPPRRSSYSYQHAAE